MVRKRRELNYIDGDAARVAQNILSKKIGAIKIRNGERDFEKQILELDFDGLILENQICLVEFVLQVVLRNAMRGRFIEKGLTVVVDECQFLDFGQGSAMRNLLELGRKQNVSMILAAPEIPLTDKSKLSIAAEQCGTKAYFKPSVDCGKLAKRLDPRNVVDWTIELNTLERGMFVAMGLFTNQNGVNVKGPITVTMSDDCLQNNTDQNMVKDDANHSSDH